MGQPIATPTPNPKPESPADTLKNETKTYVFDTTFTFRLRRHKGGSFHGLWELALLDKKGHADEIISDADALVYCLENLQGKLEAEGF